jgi:hypothetical protein
MAAIPATGSICDEIAVAKVTATCTRDPAHRVVAEVCELHEANLGRAMHCRPCHDQLYDGVRMTVHVMKIETSRLEVVRTLPSDVKVILP